MITEIKLTNFKCFKKETLFPLSKINLLTGINGRGKSTLLQSLLLMRQTIEHNPNSNQIIFNGNCVRLGAYEDVKNSESSRNENIIMSFKIFNDSRLESLKRHNRLTDKVIEDIEKFSTFDMTYLLSENLTNDRVANIKELSVLFENSFLHEKGFTVFLEQNLVHYFNNKGEIREELETYPYILKALQPYAKLLSGSLMTENFSDFLKIHYIAADRIGEHL